MSRWPWRKRRTLQDKLAPHVVGKHSYGDPAVHDWGEGASLEIGAFCSFAEGVQIFLGGEHRTDWVSTFPFNVLWESARHITGHPHTRGNVHIGHDVWVARDATILSGVTIGDGAVIGAGAVIGKDVPPYAVAAGNPAQVVRMRFAPEVIARLLTVQWWNWPDERIAQHLPRMLSGDVVGFLDAAEAELPGSTGDAAR